MIEFTHRDRAYRARKLDAFTQMNILARCGPIIGPMFSIRPAAEEEGEEGVRRMGDQVNAFLEALRKMTDEERMFVTKTCLASVQRREGNGTVEAWADIFRNGHFLYEDLDNLFDMLQITAQVLKELFSSFLSIQADVPNGSTELLRPTLVSNG